MLGLAGTQEPVVAKINANLVKLPGAAEMQEALRALGYQPPYAMSPAQMDALIRADVDAWGLVIRKAGIKGD